MKLVYVAGKFRGNTHPENGYNQYEQEKNIRVAEQLAHAVWLTGKAVGVCPHSMTRFWQGSAPDELWLKGDIVLMLRCDAVLMCANWQDSAGAREEKRIAEENGIPVFYNMEDLKRWL